MAGGAFPQDDDEVRPFGVDSPEAHLTNGEFDDRPWSSNHVHSLPQSFLDVPFDSANVLDRKSVLAGEAHELRKANREAKECRKRGGVTRPDRRVSREMMTFTPQRFHVWVYTRLATD
jgi:hypothetical protein